MRKIVLTMAAAGAVAILGAGLAGATNDNLPLRDNGVVLKVDRTGWLETDGEHALVTGTYTCDPADRPAIQLVVILQQEQVDNWDGPATGDDHLVLPCTGKPRPLGTVVPQSYPDRAEDWRPGEFVSLQIEVRELDGAYSTFYSRYIAFE